MHDRSRAPAPTSPLCAQLVKYLTLRLQALSECFPDQALVVYGIASDGKVVVIIRCEFQPRPVGAMSRVTFRSSEVLPLAGAGAMQIARLLCATPEQLGDMLVPRTSVQLQGMVEPLALGRRLGSGGFCEVYEAQWPGEGGSGAPVAVKLSRSADKVAWEHLAVEAEMLQTLAAYPDSPHIVKLVYPLVGALPASSEPHALVVRPVGQPVHMAIGQLLAGQQRTDAVFGAMAGVLAALQAAHGMKLLHNDVRPSNVILQGDNGRAVLIDWGVASRLERRIAPRGQSYFMCDAALAAMAQKVTWTPSPFSDLQSAAYTAAALLQVKACGSPPWLMPPSLVASARSAWFVAEKKSGRLDARLVLLWDAAHAQGALQDPPYAALIEAMQLPTEGVID